METHEAQPAERPAGTSAAEHPPLAPDRKRPARRTQAKSMWAAIGWDVMVAAVPITASAVGAVIGVAHIPWLALLLAGAGVAAVAVCIERALKARQLAERSGWLAIGLAAALLLPLGALTYHQWFDPAARAPQTYQFVVNGSQTQELHVAGEAGGEPQVLVESLIGGHTYPFECWTVAPGFGGLHQHRL
jgi:hypothetical protein